MVFLSKLLFETICKRSTGLPGLPVCERPRHILSQLYRKTLRVLNQLPDECAYKNYTRDIILYRLKIVDETPNPDQIEQKINSGQVEELIIQARNELKLARNFCEWKPWENLVEMAPVDQWKWPPSK
ncbi:hypothetical protein O3M35_008980 [Rhynocoris fuscipes]|uniref:NADH dehydrogenase [ubiquinone] 1 alpha subcomplex subunit 5 n=1 Tax=Rhynocoris fuscipes TaxID=488301 RepID=A0AAW1D8X7_9HEMI